jgi:uncharacterized repeat protein (TIGR03803 family)
VDGETPYGPVILDSKGNLYGTTYRGGLYGWGTVFKVNANGRETVLYSFGEGTDGGGPVGGLVRDSMGNLYGTTIFGGRGSGGVFEVSRVGAETLLYAFGVGASGKLPEAGLLLDPAGNLYGTASAGGDLHCHHANGCGVVFVLTP